MNVSFSDLLGGPDALVLPGVYDALSARMAEQAGFEAAFVSGFCVVGSRFGVPDVGLRAMADIAGAVADIRSACKLPLFVDMDDGYGDAKVAVHNLHIYERMGVAAVMVEDQRWPKRCGHLDGKQVIPTDDMVSKVRAMAGNRLVPDTFIFARTDARAVLGLDEAMRRGEQYIAAGADGLFIEAPQSVEELAKIGRAFDVPLIANPLEGGKSPVLKPQEYRALGFSVLPYGLHLLMRVARVMRDALKDLRSQSFSMTYEDTALPFAEYLNAVGLSDWLALEQSQETS
jgi:2-methylisocitrate lyase-like PEP mutase family enzyme